LSQVSITFELRGFLDAGSIEWSVLSVPGIFKERGPAEPTLCLFLGDDASMSYESLIGDKLLY
jgi:hypothetical protein